MFLGSSSLILSFLWFSSHLFENISCCLLFSTTSHFYSSCFLVSRTPQRVMRKIRNIEIANPASPYSIPKRPGPQICPNLSQRLFLGVPVRGLKNCQDLSKFVRKLPLSNVGKFLTTYSPPDWNPQKTIVGTNFGQIWGSGRFRMLEGEKGLAISMQHETAT